MQNNRMKYRGRQYNAKYRHMIIVFCKNILWMIYIYTPHIYINIYIYTYATLHHLQFKIIEHLRIWLYNVTSWLWIENTPVSVSVSSSIGIMFNMHLCALAAFHPPHHQNLYPTACGHVSIQHGRTDLGVRCGTVGALLQRSYLCFSFPLRASK